MNLNPPTYEAGDVIAYATHGGRVRYVKVTERFDDVKNGYPGFDGICIPGTVDGGMSVWGYDDQIVRKCQVDGDKVVA